ncbi:hypothetical protein ES332_D13G095400v1 [Gossypium tomentosum]|uniref:Uncharacterized protein n=1 Tax=Gossypium tomentosum TaxID=34277 RepID=A0A5D2HVB9_GOSTO|nr:hypothetical protein ES332_D13G095400v1 [Gossypium tomentosum]
MAKTPLSAIQETSYLPKSYLLNFTVSLQNTSSSGTPSPLTRTRPFSYTSATVNSPFLIYQKLYCMRCFLNPKSRMLVTFSIFRHCMSHFISFPRYMLKTQVF